MDEGRKAEFKTGLGDANAATQRHAQKEERLVKSKREDRIQRQRRQGGRGQLEEHEAFAKLLASNAYNKAALLARGELRDLLVLNELLQKGSNAELEQHVPALLFEHGQPLVLIALLRVVRDYAGNPVAAEMPRLALCLACLVNLTGSISSHTVAIAGTVLKEGLLMAATRILSSLLPDSESELASDLYSLVGNLMCSCPEARDAVIASPLLPCIIKGITTLRAENARLTSNILYVCNASMDCGPDLPANAEYVRIVWHCVGHFWIQSFPPPMRQRDEQLPPRMLDSMIGTLEAIAMRVEPDALAALVTSPHLPNLLPFMVGAVLRLEPALCIMTARILVQVGRITLPASPLQHCMVEAGAIAVMRRLVQDSHERVRREGILWLGNLGTESSQFVARLIEQQALKEMQLELLHPTAGSLIDQCLRALMGMAQRCLMDRAQDTLYALIDGLNIVHLTALYVDRPGKEKLTLEILAFWYELLKQSAPPMRQQIAASLEECRAEDAVAKLLGSPHQSIYKAAEAVDELLQRGGEAMEEEEDL
jgi:hypothetical protein